MDPSPGTLDHHKEPLQASRRYLISLKVHKAHLHVIRTYCGSGYQMNLQKATFTSSIGSVPTEANGWLPHPCARVEVLPQSIFFLFPPTQSARPSCHTHTHTDMLQAAPTLDRCGSHPTRRKRKCKIAGLSRLNVRFQWMGQAVQSDESSAQIPMGMWRCSSS
jgi:hypothetical protein